MNRMKLDNDDNLEIVRRYYRDNHGEGVFINSLYDVYEELTEMYEKKIALDVYYQQQYEIDKYIVRSYVSSLEPNVVTDDIDIFNESIRRMYKNEEELVRINERIDAINRGIINRIKIIKGLN